MRALGGALAAALAVAIPSCAVSGLAFRADTTVEVVSPRPRATVTLPLVLRWTDATNGPHSYAVFVDRAPMGSGKALRSLVGKNDTCRITPGCPDAAYLQGKGVYLTTAQSLTLDFLADLRPARRGTSKDPHEVTIVRLDGDRRDGESAFRVAFFVRR